MTNRKHGTLRELRVPNPREMLDQEWPRTPGKARYEETRLRYNLAGGTPPGDNPDDAAFRALWDTQTYQNEASRILYERALHERSAQDWTLNLLDLASTGTTRDAMGIGVELTLQQQGGTGTRPARLFSRFPKHPDWMGMCNALAHVRGKHAAIFEATNSAHTIGVVIVTAENHLEDEEWDPDREGALPTQEIRMLHDLLMEHGASSCRWIPSTGFKKDDDHLIEERDWAQQTRLTSEPEEGVPRTAVVSVETMNDWPCTPGRKRNRAANRLSDQLQMGIITPAEADPNTLEDVHALNLIRQGNMFQNSIIGEFITRTNGHLTDQQFLETVLELTERADRDDTIGFASQFNQGSQQGFVFAELLRDPTWLGMNPVLPTVEGNLISIRESKTKPGQPGVVLGFIMAPGMRITDQPEGEFPEGTARLLRNVLRWHQAKAIHWRQ